MAVATVLQCNSTVPVHITTAQDWSKSCSVDEAGGGSAQFFVTNSMHLRSYSIGTFVAVSTTTQLWVYKTSIQDLFTPAHQLMLTALRSADTARQPAVRTNHAPLQCNHTITQSNAQHSATSWPAAGPVQQRENDIQPRTHSECPRKAHSQRYSCKLHSSHTYAGVIGAAYNLPCAACAADPLMQTAAAVCAQHLLPELVQQAGSNTLQSCVSGTCRPCESAASAPQGCARAARRPVAARKAAPADPTLPHANAV
jgi:hypothetical protein